MNRRSFLSSLIALGSLAVSRPASALARRPSPSDRPPIPNRVRVGDPWEATPHAKIIITVDGIDVSWKCVEFDQQGGWAWCHPMHPDATPGNPIYATHRFMEPMHGSVVARYR